jgi:acyl carrier protein
LPGPTPSDTTTGTTPLGPEDVLAEIRGIVVEVIGEDYVSELDIERATQFRADLDVESIELVALGEALRERYGDRIRLAEWIGGMSLDEIIAMTVGQLVDHIVARLAGADEAGGNGAGGDA